MGFIQCCLSLLVGGMRTLRFGLKGFLGGGVRGTKVLEF